jgi:hypothetical protein
MTPLVRAMMFVDGYLPDRRLDSVRPVPLLFTAHRIFLVESANVLDISCILVRSGPVWVGEQGIPPSNPGDKIVHQCVSGPVPDVVRKVTCMYDMLSPDDYPKSPWQRRNLSFGAVHRADKSIPSWSWIAGNARLRDDVLVRCYLLNIPGLTLEDMKEA